MIALTPTHAAAHILPVNAGLGASEVGPGTDLIAHLVRIVTRQGAGGVCAWTGHGLSPTFSADCIIPSPGLGAAPPGREAAVLVSVPGPECLIPTLTVSQPVDALVPASHIVAVSVAAGISAPVSASSSPESPAPAAASNTQRKIPALRYIV